MRISPLDPQAALCSPLSPHTAFASQASAPDYPLLAAPCSLNDGERHEPALDWRHGLECLLAFATSHSIGAAQRL